MTPLFIGGLGMQEVLLIALVVLLFFRRQEDSRTDERSRQGCAFVQGRDVRYGKRNRGRTGEE